MGARRDTYIRNTRELELELIQSHMAQKPMLTPVYKEWAIEFLKKLEISYLR